jgi:CRISPR/Cas system-associated endoribonuclease Cas2
MKSRGNVGVEGVASIRIGDMQICDLPIAESAIAKQQIPIAEDTERQNKINNILAGYPTQKISYLEGRINECRTNVERITQMKAEQSAMISEYTSQITLCKFRDEEIARIDDDDPEKDEKIKALFKRFPPYKVDAMNQQITQSNETIERGDAVIAQEYKSITELSEIKTLCEQRDIKLRHLGVKVAAG